MTGKCTDTWQYDRGGQRPASYVGTNRPVRAARQGASHCGIRLHASLSERPPADPNFPLNYGRKRKAAKFHVCLRVKDLLFSFRNTFGDQNKENLFFTIEP